jgi:RNA polymerase sigma factor (sigma-70 family)
MNGSEADDEIVDLFEACVWATPAGDLQALASELQAELRRRNLDVRQVVTRQTDETLVLAFQLGLFAAEAFTELYTRYWSQVSRWMRQFGAEEHEARDLAQDLFFKCYRGSLRSYQPTQSFRAYLWPSARHLFIEKVVRRRRPELTEHLDRREGTGNVEEEVARRELEARMSAALALLPEELRAVLVRVLEGGTPAEIATALRVPIRRVYRLLWEARNLLAEILGFERPPTNRGRKPSAGPTDPDSPNP